MFGISECNILDQGDDPRMGVEDNKIVRIMSINSIPRMIVDGVDSVSIYYGSEGVYRIEYGGFAAGWLSVTQEGVEELADALLQDQSEIPNWAIREKWTDLPGWLQEKYEPPEPIRCDECSKEVSVTRIVTPIEPSGRYCPDCWSQIREKY
jgi:hypothetical protein